MLGNDKITFIKPGIKTDTVMHNDSTHTHTHAHTHTHTHTTILRPSWILSRTQDYPGEQVPER